MNYIERNRDFKGVWIPKEIWLNEELTMIEKVILTEIDSLDNDEHCVAGNEYLAQFCQCSESKVSKAIKKLTDLGYIEIVSFDGRHRRLRSCIVKNTIQANKKYEADYGKIRAINIGNNIDNNLFINMDESSSPSVLKTETSEVIAEQRKSEGEVDEPSTPPKEKPKRVSLKDQLLEYVSKLDYSSETKDYLLKWIFNIGLPKNVRLQQLQDMLKDIWEQSKDEAAVAESIRQSYLKGWFGFYPVNKSTPVYKTPAQPKQTPSTPLKPDIPYRPTKEELDKIFGTNYTY